MAEFAWSGGHAAGTAMAGRRRALSRYVHFRDFDWVLLIFVLIICLLGVSEIYSATLHTKFEGMHIRQVYWIVAGVALMFLVSLINYQALLEFVPWMYGCQPDLAGFRVGLRQALPGRQALDRFQALPFSALGMGQAHSDSDHGEVFCRVQGKRTAISRAGEGRSRRAVSDAAGVEAAGPGYGADLYSDRDHGAGSGRHEAQARNCAAGRLRPY